MIRYLLFRSLYMDICLPVCGGVFRKFLKISSTYIGKFSYLCGGISLNFFKKSSYYKLDTYHTFWRGVLEKILKLLLLILDICGTKLNGLRETFFLQKKISSLYMDNREQKLRTFLKNIPLL